MAAKRNCVNCKWRPIRRRLRCGTCANYLDTHGHDRPVAMVIRHVERVEQQRAS